jgi:dihydrolipoamide dehydrogenase
VSSDTEVRVPDIGDFTDVPVIEIHVSPGDHVEAEDPLVTLESDKATMDVPAPAAGVVSQLRVKVGDRVSEGSVVLVMEGGDADGDGESESASESASESEPEPKPEAEAEAEAESEPAPQVSHEPPPPAAAGDYDAQVVVIGAGPGGYTAAFRAADLGLKTVLIERYDRLGGVCLNVGCIPSKALLHAARVVAEAEEMSAHGITFGEPKIDPDALQAWKESVVARLTSGLDGLAKQRKVEVVHGTAQFTGPHELTVGDRAISFANCIIAAGSSGATLPDLPDDERIVDSTGALALTEVPKRLLVVGCGIIGLEMACVWDALGAKVTMVELLDQLIPGCDPDLVKPLQKRISERYEAIHLGTKVGEIKPQKSGLKVELGDHGAETFDRVLIAIGRRPNGGALNADAAGVQVDDKGFIAVDAQRRTNVPWIYAIGDTVEGPMLAHKASHEGVVAAEAIAGDPGAAFDPRAIPSVAYTDPEVAWMGLTEMAARESGVEYEKASFPWAASGRALSIGRDDGMTKLLVEPGTRRVLGAGIVGINAGELIAETVHAYEMGADTEDLALTIHPHPTLSETVMFAAEMAEGTITDLMPPRKRR